MVPHVVPQRRVVLLLVLTALALLTLDSRNFGPIRVVRTTTMEASAPVKGFLSALVSPIGTAWTASFGVDDLRAENDQLRTRIAELEGELQAAPNVAAELDGLRTATGVDFAGQFELLAARTVSDRQTPLERIVELDRGSSSGVIVGQPVVTGEGLVGQIVTVSQDRSVVRLVTDPRTSIGVTSPASGAVGVATGQGDERRMRVDLVERDKAEVDINDVFITSGFEQGLFPPAIPIGVLRLDSNGVASLVPAADLDYLGFVSVMLTNPNG